MTPARFILDLSPLVIATFHGYGAAWLAVKMLFRPLYPIKLLGWRVPFTPGLLPAERDRFVDAFAGVIAEKLLTAEIIEEELVDLRIDGDVEAIARRRYTERSRPEALVQIISTQMIEVLTSLKSSHEAKLQIARETRTVLDRQMGREYHQAVQYVARMLINEDLIFRIVDRAVDDLADQLTESINIRELLGESINQLPDAIFTGERPLQNRVALDIIHRLSQKLDFKAIIKRRFETFSNEIFEQIIYETAGREIQGIMNFGAMIGFAIGVFQTLINLGRHLFGQ